MKLLVLCALVGFVVAEAPYAPSGWRPQGAQFNLPRQYGAPQRQNYEVEVTQENVEYAGTVNENAEDAPADDDDSLRFQGAPTTNAPRFNPPKSPAPARQRVQQVQQARFQNQYNPQEFEVARNVKVGQLRANVQFGRQQAGPQQAGPQQEYGPPARGTQTEQQPDDVEDAEEPEEQTVVAVANAGSSGQYYVLQPDNNLQRVMFLTSQTEEDRRRNGFTAQLRYTPVQPIVDPIYVYNEQGQLVRVFNK